MPKPWLPRQWPDAVPRFVTPRNPDRETVGHEVVEIMRRLGFEPMPWNVDNWLTMYELDDDGSLWYREARITVPRQSSKTTATLARQVHRVTQSERLGWGDRPVAAFTMQHASDARSKMVNEWQPIVRAAGFEEWKRSVLSNGRESIEWTNGGRMITFPPNATGAHGGTLDLVDIDEAFAHVDNRAEQGTGPSMITRFSPQNVVQSTAGTNESVYLKGKVDDGRARVESGDDGHVYYLEFSAGPDDDVHNPEHWPRFMPALGYTQTMKALLLEHDRLSEEEWARAFGNMWTGSTTQIIPAVAWAAAAAPKTRRVGKVWMAVDAAPGINGVGRSASISVASYRGAEVHTEVIAHGAGLSWVADKLGELTRQQTVQVLYLDSTGPIGQIVPDIKAKSMANVEVIDTQTMVNACGRFHQAVLDKTVRHRDQAMLNAAVEGAAKRVLNDGWAWKRRTSSADISPLVACTLAHWGAATNPDRGPIKMYTRTA